MDERNNSGDWNSGDWNSGDRNSGDMNSGDWNSGYFNSGNRNSGDWNSGDRNSGDMNSGDWNSGDRNSGDWNSGDRNSGYFNTNRPKIRMFNKETNLDFGSIIFPIYLYFDLTEWISEECLTEKQKKEHPDYKTLGGWLITYDYKEAAIKSFNENCDKEQAEQTINLPNFDYDIFEEITGITKEMLEEKLKDAITNKKEIIIDGIKYRRVD